MISLHTYLLFNISIAISFIISKIFFSIHHKGTQWQKLQFMRNTLIISVMVFLIIPWAMTFIPANLHSTLTWDPFLKMTGSHSTQDYALPITESVLTPVYKNGISMQELCILLWGMGFAFFIFKYIKNIIFLKNLKSKALCRHKMHRVQILVSEAIDVPFCFRFLKYHYVMIPLNFLENKLVHQHELQHIRQGDTTWHHILSFLKICCFWNPFIYFLTKAMHELQEFSCDETVILRKKAIPAVYAECLMHSASSMKTISEEVFGVHFLSKSILYRRVNMLFDYRQRKNVSFLMAYLLCFFIAMSSAYAFNSKSKDLTVLEVTKLVSESNRDKRLQVAVTPQVLDTLNQMRNDEKLRQKMQLALKRMKQYQPYIQDVLVKNNMPKDFLALPLVESGYRILPENQNPVKAAGLWQIIPETGKHLGLRVQGAKDDRLDPVLSTNAAIKLLQQNYDQFNDWKLAVVAYEIGEEKTAQLIQDTHSHDVNILARATNAPKGLQQFVALFDAMVIVMNHPGLLDL
jgi:membrane-bound lytic murein transglycosylase D